jgi:hypothetical protein
LYWNGQKIHAEVDGLVDNEGNEDDWWEEFWNLVLEDDDEAPFIFGTYEYAQHIDTYCSRRPYRTPPYTGDEWVKDKLNDETTCYDMFRMSPEMFYRLHELLTTQYGLTSSPKSSCREALGIFLWICGAPQSVRQANDRFERSLATVHNLFYKVLKCLVALSGDIINPRDADFTTMHPRLQNTRFYPEFKRCIEE